MALQIGAVAPDFEAQTTEGKIKFHDWIGNSWALLFSHPKDFTPVCTTELGALAKLKPEFDKRGVKLMGLSVDPVDRHAKWAEDIRETQGTAPNFPMIGDTDFNVSKLYDMLPASTSGDVATRTANDNQTVRNVFVIGPDKKIKLVLVYPMSTGRNFQEILRAIEFTSDDGQTPHLHTRRLEARRRRDHLGLGLRRGSQEDLSRGLEVAEAVYPDRAAAEISSGVPTRCAYFLPKFMPDCAPAAKRGALRSIRPGTPDLGQALGISQLAISSPAVDDSAVKSAPQRHIDDRHPPTPVFEQRQRGQFERRIAKQSEQRAIKQSRRPRGIRRPANEHDNACDIKQIEQDCGREPDLSEHVADFGREEALGDEPQEQDIDRNEHDQGRKIKNRIPFQAILALFAYPLIVRINEARVAIFAVNPEKTALMRARLKLVWQLRGALEYRSDL